MANLVYTESGPWGGGKGAPLTETEFNRNFYELLQDVNAIQNPTTPFPVFGVYHVQELPGENHGDPLVVGSLAWCLAQMPNGGDVVLPIGDFRWRTPNYLNSAASPAVWRITGQGHKTRILLDDLDDDFALYVNQGSDGSHGASYPGLRLVISNLYVLGNDTEYQSLAYAYQCGVEVSDCYLNKLLHGVKSSSYCDQMRFRRNHVIGQRVKLSGSSLDEPGYLYYQGSQGDGLVFEQNIFSAYGQWNGALYLRGGIGSGVRQNIQGSYYFRDCENVDFSGNYLETVKGRDVNYNLPGNANRTAIIGKVTLANSSMNMKGNTLWNFTRSDVDAYDAETDNYPVLVDDSTFIYNAVNKASQVVLEDNRFQVAQTGAAPDSSATKRTRPDVYIIPSNDTRVSLKNNVAEIRDGVLSRYPIGVWVGSSNTGAGSLDTALTTYQALLSGDVRIQKDAAAVWSVQAPDGSRRFYSPGVLSSPNWYTNAQADAQPAGHLPDATYYYRVRASNLIGESTASGEVSVVVGGGKTGAVRLYFNNKAAFVSLRVWRGTSAGVYTHYADLSTPDALTVLYDRGDNLSGVPWIDSAVPSLPAGITSYEGTLFATRKEIRAAAAPIAGTWAVGDRATIITPVVGQPKAWVCTVSGAPGTWVSEGNL